MKYCVVILIHVLLIGCNGENVPDCFQNSGDIIRKEFSVESFNKITVYERIELILIEGPEIKVVLETGEYLENEIDVRVVNNRLELRNENACNLTRNYGITKFYVTAPDLIELRNSSGLKVSNQGVLNYSYIKLISEDFEEEDEYHTDGPFDLNVNADSLALIVNNLSHTTLRGSVDKFNIGFYSGDARLDAENLLAKDIELYHRGTNDLILHPTQSVKGTILSTGDVILVNNPPVVEVEELYTGRLIYRD